jgi:hypothetical protein
MSTLGIQAETLAKHYTINLANQRHDALRDHLFLWLSVIASAQWATTCRDILGFERRFVWGRTTAKKAAGLNNGYMLRKFYRG